MLNLTVVLIAIVQGLLGLFVFQKKRDSTSNRAFGLLSLASMGWALTNYVYTLHPVASSSLFNIRLVLFWVVIQNTAFCVFALNYPAIKLVMSRQRLKQLLIFSVITSAATLSHYVFLSVTVQHGQSIPNAGPLMALFLIHAILTIGTGLRSLMRKTRRATGIQKKQLQLILFATALIFTVVPITNFAITLAFKVTIFAKFAPFYTLIFAGIIAYAIVAQKLFDIRAAVARSVAYLLLLGTIAIIYSVGLFGIINVFFGNDSQQLLRQILSVFLLTPLAIGFQGAKGFFDKVTNKVFYRDSYDFQEVLDNLGDVVTSEIDLKKLLNGTRGTLSEAFKSSSISFILFKEGKPYLEGTAQGDFLGQLTTTSGHIEEQRKDLIVTDELSANNPLRHVFHDSNIAICLRLKTQHQLVGCVLIGDKRSGDIYGAQDQRLLTIISRELAIGIQNALHFQEIASFNLTLQAKVDEATRKLRNANKRLTELDESKDDFISMASHQLRTPLTSVKGYLSLVLEGDTGKITATQRKMLGQAFTSSQRMVYLIADLLNVSRLKTGKFIIEASPINLATLVSDELAQLKETAASRSLNLVYTKPENFPVLMLDETKTRQVIMNFVDNAIYYTPADGTITIELLDKGPTVELRVVDNGIGVPRNEQHHLFTKFYRAGNARKARPDGTGLGLFMAKKVIVAQGGALIFESTEGKGSTFGFMFSKAKLAEKSAMPARAKDTTPNLDPITPTPVVH